VGTSYRNKSVKELIAFKDSVANKVNNVISSEKRVFKSQSDWNSFVDNSIAKLKSSQ
jgi:formylmethanofuran dehydrogenase subunit E-like metal-binding protein